MDFEIRFAVHDAVPVRDSWTLAQRGRREMSLRYCYDSEDMFVPGNTAVSLFRMHATNAAMYSPIRTLSIQPALSSTHQSFNLPHVNVSCPSTQRTPSPAH
jgi:hypothetical protein